jgi:hypothetical protein
VHAAAVLFVEISTRWRDAVILTHGIAGAKLLDIFTSLGRQCSAWHDKKSAVFESILAPHERDPNSSPTRLAMSCTKKTIHSLTNIPESAWPALG